MTTENQAPENTEQQQSEQDATNDSQQLSQEQQDENAAMLAGFDAAQGIEQPESQPAEPEPEAPKLIAGMTEEQIKELAATVEALKGREAKVFGTMGSLKQSIDAIKAQPAPAAQPVPVALTADKFKRLKAEFPEIADMLAADLSEALTVPVAQAPAPQVDVEQIVEQKLQTSSQAYEAKLLTVMHPDWREVTQSAEFTGWKEQLPPEEKDALDTSWDATFIGEKLKSFKDWKAKTVQTKQANQERLRGAVPATTGRSVARNAPTETDAFLAGFKAARGG